MTRENQKDSGVTWPASLRMCEEASWIANKVEIADPADMMASRWHGQSVAAMLVVNRMSPIMFGLKAACVLPVYRETFQAVKDTEEPDIYRYGRSSSATNFESRTHFATMRKHREKVGRSDPRRRVKGLNMYGAESSWC